MTGRFSFVAPVVASLLLAGCVEMPAGPTVAVMPGPNKPFDVFVQDIALCRDWASHSIGVPGHDAAAEQMQWARWCACSAWTAA